MKYEIVKLEEKVVMGFTARTNNNSPQVGAVIGGLWEKFFEENGYAKIPEKKTGKIKMMTWKMLKSIFISVYKWFKNICSRY